MEKKFIRFSFVFLTMFILSSCGKNPMPEKPLHYVELKMKLEAPVSITEYGNLLDSCTNSNGETYFLYCLIQDEEKTFTVTRQNANELTQKVVPLAFDETVYFLFICADMAGNIILSDTNISYVYKNGSYEASQSFPSWPVGGMIATDDNTVICQVYADSPYYIFDLSTGTHKGIFLDKEFLFEQGLSQPFLYGPYGQEMLITGTGLYTHDGDDWNLRVPGSKTSMSKSSFAAKKIEKGENDSYIVFDSNFQYTYILAEVDSDVREITLRVTAWQDRDILRTALTEYQIAHPNVTIEYSFRCTDLPKTEQEANTLLQITNTEIVSSQAADIYVLDYLPWQKYQENGLLLDISDVVELFAEDESYFGNVLTAYGTEDGLYAVPWFFATKFILCKKDLTPYIQNIHEFASYLESHPEDPGLIPHYYRDMPEVFLAMMYEFYRDDLYDDETLTPENVEKFLTSARIIYNRVQENTDARLMRPTEKNYLSFSYLQYFPFGTDVYLFYEEQEGSVLLLPTTAMGITDLLKVNYHPDYAMIPVEGIRPRLLFGIHSMTEEEETAKDLLRYLLSYYAEAGNTDNSINMFGFLPGLPIYKPVITSRFERFYLSGELKEDNPIYTYSEEETENLLAVLDNFRTPVYSTEAFDDEAFSVFVNGSAGFLTGEKSLEEAADEIYHRLLLLQQENQ